MNNKKHATFEFIRIIATVGVVLGHCHIICFGTPWKLDQIEQDCVSLFFIMSGIFMANSLNKQSNETPFHKYLNFQKKRVNSFLIPTILVTIIYVIINVFILHKYPGRKNSILFWPALMFMETINHIPGYDVLWYISTLFWCGIPLAALLCFDKKKNVTVVLPILFFLSFSFIYSNNHTLTLHYYPILGNWISLGLLRGLMELIFGIEIYYFNNYFSRHYKIKENFLSKSIIVFIEFSSFLTLLFIFMNAGDYDFVIFPVTAILFSIFLQEKEILFSFSNKLKKQILFISKYTFYVYLSLNFPLTAAIYFLDFNSLNSYLVYITSILISFIFGILMHYITSLITRFLFLIKDKTLISKKENVKFI